MAGSLLSAMSCELSAFSLFPLSFQSRQAAPQTKCSSPLKQRDFTSD
ncbi:hypothetical protein D1AOALGA4SA_6474 [Olavius algarvensis Delta 1 endosymbiont]|nr:hypothetical protein D1AOALGA4SA_6474 [Olavius algarvensis Delta 1 endosymbiont]